MGNASVLLSLLLAAVGGVLHFLGFVGFGVWPLALICLAVLWQALEATAHRLSTAALVGFVFGCVSYAGGYFWLWRIVDVFLHGDVLLGAVVGLADAAWFALRYALYAMLYTLLRQRGWGIVVAGVPSLVLMEWLYPLLFPVHLGHAFAEQTIIVQLSALGGPLLMSALVAFLNATIFETWRWGRGVRPLPFWVWAFTLLAVSAAWVYGERQLDHLAKVLPAAPALQVGIVQGNLGVQQKGRDAGHDHQLYLDQTRELLAHGPVDLVVWPETVYARGLRGPLPVSGELIRDHMRISLLFGAPFVRGETGQRLAYNSALLIDAGGVIRHVYEKNLLIPFTEYVPFAALAPSIAARLADASHFSAATDVPPLWLGEWRIATPICYEAVRPAFVRRMMNAGHPHLIVTLANDAWFGDSQEPWLHLAMAKLRAVEHRRYLVRATNTGVSAIIDPAGRTVARSGVLTRENLRGTVALLDETTIYTRFGDWAGWLAAALVLAALIRPRGSLHDVASAI